jgi:hypothetical protein
LNGKDKVETRLYNRPREVFIPARPAPQTSEKIESGRGNDMASEGFDRQHLVQGAGPLVINPIAANPSGRLNIGATLPHLERILRLDRLRLRGPIGARDEFLLAPSAQDLRKLAKRIPPPTSIFAA